VRAATDVSLLRIDREHFFELIDRSPTIRLAIEQLNAQRLTDNVRAFSGTEDVRQWQEVAVASIQRLSRNEEVRLMAKHASVGAPLAIFLGVMLDGIPESIVIGSGFSSFSTYQFTFLAAVFLANVPEAIASSMGMSDAGFSTKKIFWLWGALVGSGVVAAALGNIFLLGAPPTAITLEVGLSTIAGFLCAFLFSVI
jgi:zinc transporter ZupT